LRRVEIPKPGKGAGVSLLGVPCTRDRVVQATIKLLLEPIYLLSLHIDDKGILRLIGTTLRSGIMKDGIVTPSEKGTPQGSPLSPLLSNVVLDELDKELERRGLEFCRFADDCNIFVRSPKAAERVMGSISKFIEGKLKLKINRDKSKVAHSRDVNFLGLTIIDGAIVISDQSMKRARRRLRSRFVDQQKKRSHLFKKLIKRGVLRGLASKVFSNNGRWVVQYLCLNQGIPCSLVY